MKLYLKQLILSLLCLSGSTSAYAYTIYLKLFTKDCSNCYAGLYLLNSKFVELPYQIVLKKSDKINEEKLKELFELDKFKQATLIYNDELYDSLERDLSTELIVKNQKNQTVYRENIKQLNLGFFKFILSMKDAGNRNLEYNLNNTSIKTSIASMHVKKDKLYFENDFDQWFFWDSAEHKLDTLIIDSFTLERSYAIEEKVTKRSILPSIRHIKTTQYKNYIKPSNTNVFLLNDSIVYASFYLKIVDVYPNDTMSLSPVPYLLKVNIKQKQVLSIYKVPSQIDSNSYICSEFFIHQDTFYFNKIYKKDFYLDTTTQKHVYAKFVVKKNDSMLHFVSNENMFMPERYVKNKLYLTFDNPSCSRDLVTMSFMPGIYDVKAKSYVKAPIPDSVFNDVSKIATTEDHLIMKKLTLAFMGDAYKFQKDRYGIIYHHSGQYYLNYFDKQGNLLLNKKLSITPNTKPHFIDNGQYCVYLDNNNRIMFHYLFD